MTLLYSISNICVPCILMSMLALRRKAQQSPPQYGKWALFFILTFLFNSLKVFNINLIATVDLISKLLVCLIPESMNRKIERHIINLHLQGFLMWIRITCINFIFRAASILLTFFIRQLQPQQGLQVRKILIELLQKDQIQAQSLKSAQKMYEDSGINCTIITQDAVELAKSKLRLIQKQKAAFAKQQQEKIEMMRKESERGSKDRGEESGSKGFTRSNRHMAPSKKVEGGMREYRSLSPASSINNLKQSQYSQDDIGDDQSEEEVEKKPQVRVNKVDIRQYFNSEEKIRIDSQPLIKTTAPKPVQKKQASRLKRRNTDIISLNLRPSKHADSRSLSPQQSPTRPNSRLVKQLDLSASQYSDMFEQQSQLESHRLICKVQAIVQVGVAPKITLQILNLELYSDKQLRIMSLDGSNEIQKHTLVWIAKSNNSFYQLKLKNGPVNKRKIKFRGQYKQFMRFLKKQVPKQ